MRCTKRFRDSADRVAVSDDKNPAACVTANGRNDAVDVCGRRSANGDNFGCDAALLRQRLGRLDGSLEMRRDYDIDVGFPERACERVGADESRRAEVGIGGILCGLFSVPHEVDDCLTMLPRRGNRGWSCSRRAAGD